MIHIDMYKCEYCDFVCSNAIEMDKHEASHFGVTPEELHSYYSRKQFYQFVKEKYEKSLESNSVKDEMLINLKDQVDSTKSEINEFEAAHAMELTE